MRDLKTILEASLLDIEGTIESGDNYAKTMSEIRKELKVLQKMKWNIDWTTTVGEHQYEWYCPKFIEHYLGVKAHSILFAVTFYNTSREHDCDVQMFIYDKTNDYYSIACRDFLCNSKIYSTETKMIKAIVDEIKNKFKEDNLSRTMIRLKDLISLERFEKINEASILDVEDHLSKDFDFKTLVKAKTFDEYLAHAKFLKDLIDTSGNAHSSRGLKKGKPYIFIWYDDTNYENIEIAFVDKWPIVDKKRDHVDDTYYVIFWDVKDDKVKVMYDNSGNEFSSLIDSDYFGRKSMQGAVEIPTEFISDLRSIMKNAEVYWDK